MSRQADTYMGVVLYVAPQPDVWREDPDELSRHHRHFPSTDPVLARKDENNTPAPELGGWALRTTGIQLILPEQHNEGEAALHNFYHGQESPDDPLEQLRLVLLDHAGLVPPYVMDTTKRRLEVRRATEAELTIIQQPRLNQRIGYVHVRHGHIARRFVEGMVMMQPLDHLRPRLIEQYLDRRTDPVLRRKIGHMILTQQITRLVDGGIRSDYERAMSLGLLDPRLDGMNIVGFIKRHILGRQTVQTGVLLPKITARLRRELRAA